MKVNPYIRKENNRLVITLEGRTYLDRIVTDVDGPVYAFKHEANPLLVAAAMARLSRRGDDFREIYLEEFAFQTEGAEDLLHRVVTGYGDDSVQQLHSLALITEGCSNLLTKIIEWGRLRAYLEGSTRYIFYDEKDEKGNFRIFIPDLRQYYQDLFKHNMDLIMGLYSKIVRGVTAYVRNKNPEPQDIVERIAWLGATRAQACDAARLTLPVAVKSTVGIVGSAQSVDYLIMHLLAHPLKEAQNTGAKILREVRKVAGVFFERTDMPDRGLAMVAYKIDTKAGMKELALKYLPKIDTEPLSLVKLIDYYPDNELDLVPEMLFESGEISIDAIWEEVTGWDRAKKLEVFRAYMGNRLNRRHKPGRALEAATYEWEILGDYGTFRDLQRHRIVNDWEWQRLSTKYGYDVPELIKEAGFEKDFRECFNISEGTCEILKHAGFEEESQYATLLGHKMRYRFIMNAREAFHMLELRTGPQGHPGYRKICKIMHDKLSEVHPLMGASMKFVNKGEDPELTRMAAELATQKKLHELVNK